MMKLQSIRTRITLSFVGLMAITILGCWIMNTLFLQGYYTAYKQRTMNEIYNEINAIWDSDIFEGETEDVRNEKMEQIQSQLLTLTDESGAEFFVVDNSWQKYASSSNNLSYVNEMGMRLQRYIFEGSKQPGPNSVVLQKTYYQNMNAYYLECWGILDSGYPFIITIPLQSIKESVAISNRFLAYIGMVSIIMGSIMVYLISSSITKPIRKLTDISQRMGNLNFEVKYMGNETDEIGILGKNINELSERLEETITDLKNANLELTKDIEHREQLDEMRKDFISNVSHELKTPIALIQGYAEGLRDGITDDPESMVFYCDVIADEADKMNRMVRKLLALNQIEFGSNQITIARFELRELIEGILNNSAILMEQNGITVDVKLDQKIYVYGDEFQIEEVVTNYVSNAMNHCLGEQRISVYMEHMEHRVRIYIENTGVPIPEEALDKVWIKFYKVDKARTREYGGSGIGLSIVKAIMESHNQNYGVQNTETGVAFWFELEQA